MAIWLAVVVLLVGVAVGLAVAIVRGLSLWRQVKQSSRVLGEETARISRVVDEISLQLERAQSSSERLADAGDRLRVSRARLELQLAAVREARATLRRTFWFVPGV